MKDFEKILYDKLGQATVKDVAPLYNKEDDWQKLSAGLPERKKTRTLMWLPYAAALLFMISIGVYFLNAKHTTSNELAENAKPVIKTIIVHDTVTVVAKEKPLLIAAPSARPVIVYHNHRKTPAPVTMLILPVNDLMHKEVQPARAPDAIAVFEPKHRAHAIHIMDINNEDTRMLVRQTHFVRRDNIITYLFPVRQSNTNNQIITSPTIIDLFRP